jgi:hypothetical protein
MEKDVKRRVAAGSVALVAIAGGGAAIAATQVSPKQESQAVLNDAAKELGVSPTELSAALKGALEKRIDAAVAAGRLTKTQGDELKQRIESGDFPFSGVPAFGPERGGVEHYEMFGGLDAAATYLGVSEDELHTQLESGKSLADVAKAERKSVDGLVAALVAEAKKHLDEEVSGGDLTQDQDDQILSRLEEGIRAMVNGERPSGMPGPGFGFRRDFDRAPSFDGPPTFEGAAA